MQSEPRPKPVIHTPVYGPHGILLPWAPWHVIPADRKWFTRLAVSATLCEAMRKMKLAYPKVDEAHREALRKARAALKAEKD